MKHRFARSRYVGRLVELPGDGVEISTPGRGDADQVFELRRQRAIRVAAVQPASGEDLHMRLAETIIGSMAEQHAGLQHHAFARTSNCGACCGAISPRSMATAAPSC